VAVASAPRRSALRGDLPPAARGIRGVYAACEKGALPV